MLISYRWLQRHVALTGITPEQAADDLTLSTAEVEGIERFAPVLDDVLVGHVATRVDHPNSDHLNLCTVEVGEGDPLQIVCGAPNVDAGQRVAVARIGTRLPGDIKLKKTKIRGVESMGMICSERELGLGEEHDGIWVLPGEPTVGTPVARAVGAEDWVIEIDNKSLTHRPDLWGHRGIAAELAAIHGLELKPLDAKLPAPGAGEPFPVRIDSPACSRYLAVALDNVRGGRSPDWMRLLLLAAGQRPLDLLVDLSNFVMLDLGQPNHLFDRGVLSPGGKPAGIVVRQARADERMTTLDAIERNLTEDDLLICSGQEPVALAGVMGGEGSKVLDGTTSLLLEVAHFHPGGVRRTSSRLGLRTDSSARFEKSLDPSGVERAAGHLVSLLRELQPDVTVAAPPTDVGDWVDPACTIDMRPGRVRDVLGAEISDDEMRGILERLGFAVTVREGFWEVGVPSIRATKDIAGEHDLIEEVGRIFRYGNIPEQNMTASIDAPTYSRRRDFVRRLEDRLAGGARFLQTLSYSFIGDDTLALLGELDEPHVQVVNPVADGLSRIRRSVLPSLLGRLAENRRRRSDVRLFEIGKGYRPVAGEKEPAEVHELALAWALPPAVEGARFDDNALRRLQGVVEDLITTVEVEGGSWSAPEAGVPSWAHPGRVMQLGVEGAEPLALLAALEPGLARPLGLSGELKSDVALARVSIDALLAADERRRSYRALARFPGIKVDVALALPDEQPAASGVAAIEKAGKGLVRSVELFDVYQGPNLEAGRKSLAWHVLLQSETKTLSDKDGQKFLTRLEREAAGLGGELRRE